MLSATIISRLSKHLAGNCGARELEQDKEWTLVTHLAHVTEVLKGKGLRDPASSLQTLSR
jgi:hypothetical protein